MAAIIDAANAGRSGIANGRLMPLITEPLENRSDPVSKFDLAPSAGEYYGAVASEALSSSATAVLSRLSRSNEDESAPVITRFGVQPRVKPQITSQQDAQLQAQNAGVKLDIPNNGMPTDALQQLIEHHVAENQRQEVIQRAQYTGTDRPLTGFGVQLGASLLDPLNVATGFIPVVGEARYARMLAGAGGAFGRAGVRALVGGAEGTAGAAVLEPFRAAAANVDQDDYKFTDTLSNLAFGGVFGAGLHTTWGAAKDALYPGWFLRNMGGDDAATAPLSAPPGIAGDTELLAGSGKLSTQQLVEAGKTPEVAAWVDGIAPQFADSSLPHASLDHSPDSPEQIEPATEVMTSRGMVKINRDYDVPLLGGGSEDRGTVYLDRDWNPIARIGGKLIDRTPFVAEHEKVEADLESSGMEYMEAHRIAMKAENRLVKAAGIDPVEYEASYAADLRNVARKSIAGPGEPPPDVIQKPYEHPHNQQARDMLTEVQDISEDQAEANQQNLLKENVKRASQYADDNAPARTALEKGASLPFANLHNMINVADAMELPEHGSARHLIANADPKVQEAGLRTFVAQLIDGKEPDVEPLIKSDPDVQRILRESGADPQTDLQSAVNRVANSDRLAEPLPKPEPEPKNRPELDEAQEALDESRKLMEDTAKARGQEEFAKTSMEAADEFADKSEAFAKGIAAAALCGGSR